MPPPRPVHLLPVPTDGTAASILPAIDAAFAGGPVVHPVDPDRRASAPTPTPFTAADADDPDDPTVAVLRTSGSTGTAKEVLLQASALQASAVATDRRLGGPGSWLLALPGWHIAGLQVILRSRLAGTPLAAMDTGKPFTATAFREAASTLPGDRRYVSLVPTQLHRILDDTAATAALASFSRVLVGGAATAAALVQRAVDAGVRVVTTYGMSETCGGCVYDGVPLEGCRVSTDGDPASGTGRISLAGPMVARGYRHAPDAAAFARPGSFVTDDVGSWDGTRLQVLGRADDVIISGGINVPPLAVEELLAGIESIGEVLAVGVPDAEWGATLVALVTGSIPDPAVLRRVFAAEPAAYLPRAVLRVPLIPTRGPGKPDRSAAGELAKRLLRAR